MTTTAPFPETAIGSHLAWYFEVRERGQATPDEIDAHFAPEYRWGWGSPREPAALAAWFDRWRTMHARIDDVEQVGEHRFVVTTRLDGGPVARVWFDMEEDSPHRILRTATTEHEAADGPVDFAGATAVTESTEGHEASVPAVFTTAVGPFGGYVAALAVAAAGSYTGKSVPVSMSGHFLNAGRAGAVDVDFSTSRASSRLESLAVTLRQNGATLFEAQAWGAAVSSGPAHDLAPMPAVPTVAEAVAELDDGPYSSFGASMEAVPVEAAGDPSTLAAWVRLQPRSCFDDPWLDAARLLLPIDWLAVNASIRPHREAGGGFVVPSTLDVSVGFHHYDRHTEWVLCRAESPVAGRGLATSTATVWSEDGHVLATSILQILHRGA